MESKQKLYKAEEAMKYVQFVAAGLTLFGLDLDAASQGILVQAGGVIFTIATGVQAYIKRKKRQAH